MADSNQPATKNINPWLIAMAVILPAFMEVMDTSIAAVCIPYMAGSLSASNDEASWVLTFYLLSNAVVLPASAWFALKFGRKRFFIGSIVIFTVASFACGAANSLIVILIARLVQGAGGGALQPLSQSILTESFPPEKRGMAMGVFGLGVVVAPILGPTLGGWLTDQFSWRWAFYINIPIGVLAIFLISTFVVDPPYIKDAKPGNLDKIGFGLLALWLGAMQIILDRGQEDDWFGAMWIRYAFALMIVTFVGFIYTQLTNPKPLVDLTTFTNRNFLVGSLLIFLFGACIYGTTTLLPLFYQNLLSYSALGAGVAVAPRGVGAVIAMPLVGFLVSKVDTRILVSFGFLVFAFCSLSWGNLTLDISPTSLAWAILISGASLGFIFVPLSTVSLGDLPKEKVGNASGLFNLMRNVGGSIGISLVNTILTRHEDLHRNELVHGLAGTSPVLQRMVTQTSQMLARTYGAANSQLRAYAIVGNTLDQQAALWSYIDDLRYMALLAFCCVPLVWALKKVKTKEAIHAG